MVTQLPHSKRYEGKTPSLFLLGAETHQLLLPGSDNPIPAKATFKSLDGSFGTLSLRCEVSTPQLFREYFSGRQFVLAGLRLKFRAGSSFTFDVRRGVVRAGVFCLGFAPQA